MNPKYFEKDKIKKLNYFNKNFYNIYKTSFIEDKFINFELNNKIKIGGRIVSLKNMGKIIFGNLSRKHKTYQFCIKKDYIGEFFFKQSKFLSIGDMIGIEGIINETENKILTVFVNKFIILSKFLFTAPDKIKFIKFNRKNRIMDVVFNLKYQEKFYQKFRLLRNLRMFLNKNDFLEVETPILNKYIGGADADPFSTFHNSLKKKLYLSISPELNLKKMLVMGFHKVFQIAKCFRNEGISNKHNPEFLMMEMYVPFFTYIEMMDFVELLLKYLYEENLKYYEKKPSDPMEFRNFEIDFLSDWKKLSFVEYLNQHIEEIDIQNILNNNDYLKVDFLIKKYNINDKIEHYQNKFQSKLTIYEILYVLFDEIFADKIVQPTFITRHPIRFSGLAKPYDDISAARAELFIGTVEISNMYSELNDPQIQENFFKTQDIKHRDQEFINALKIGLPCTAGAGIGLERLHMIFENIDNIKDAIVFPH